MAFTKITKQVGFSAIVVVIMIGSVLVGGLGTYFVMRASKNTASTPSTLPVAENSVPAQTSPTTTGTVSVGSDMSSNSSKTFKPDSNSSSMARVASWLKNVYVEPSEHFGGMDQWNLAATAVSGLREKILQSGISGLYADSGLLSKTLKAIEKDLEIKSKYTAAAGMKFVRAEPGPFVWNLIEPKQGEYHWELPDLYIKTLRKYNVEPVATIRYQAEWDGIKCRSLPTDNIGKENYEYGSFSVYGPHYIGTVCNLNDYTKWLEAVAERYDGDGKNDMPGLNGKGLKRWEIFNEIEGKDQYLTNPSLYVEAQKLSYQIIKKHCPDCIVSSDGSLDVSGEFPESKPFWDAAYKAGALNYMDVRNWHWNNERQDGTKENAYKKAVQDMNNQMNSYGSKKPMWITELGTFAGTSGGNKVQQQPGGNPPNPQNPSAPAGGQPPSAGGYCGDNICDAFEKANPNACPQDCGGSSGNMGEPLPQPTQQLGQMQPPPQQSNQQTDSITQSEQDQASWYVRRYANGFANGVILFTPDIVLKLMNDGGGPGNGSILGETSSGVQVRLLFYVQKLLSAKIGKFTTAEELADGQYKFVNNGGIVYILWESSASLSAQIKGRLKVTDLYGNEKSVDASQLQMSKTPVFAESL